MNAVTEQKSRHTPGPWAYDADSGEIYFDDGDVYPVIAHVDREGVSDEQAIADGNILASASAMLEFIRQIAKRDPVFVKGHEKQVIADARALVAKAEGR